MKRGKSFIKVTRFFLEEENWLRMLLSLYHVCYYIEYIIGRDKLIQT